MTTPEKKPYHKKRHPWRNQDLRSPEKRAAGPRPEAAPVALPADVVAGIKTLLAVYDAEWAVGRRFTREDNTNVATVRALVNR